MRSLHYTATAQEDLIAISLYIADESGSRDVAASFIQKLDKRCKHLASLSGTLGTARPDLRGDLRSTPCQGYVIFFRYRADMLEIVNILHASRDVIAYFDGE